VSVCFPFWHFVFRFLLWRARWHLAEFQNKMEIFPRYLTVEQATELHDLGQKFLMIYVVLAERAFQQNLLMWPLKPKFHV
jgi:hypothetical protein